MIPAVDWGLVEEVRELKRERNAIILAHNYMDAGVQLAADYVGDSYDLALRAMEARADALVFAGVRFMAEQAKALNYDREVLSPDPRAGCTVADSLDAALVREYRESYPGLPLVIYVNSNMDVKAMADYVVTSSTAAKVVKRLPGDAVLFGPDSNLAAYVERATGKRVIRVPPNGRCVVHSSYHHQYVEEARRRHPRAKVMVHPEAPPEVLELADFVGSTNQMLEFALRDGSGEFVVGTEVGMLNALELRVPGKRFHPLVEEPFARCPFMAMITLEKVRRSLERGVHRVEVPRDLAEGAREAFERTRRLLEGA